MYPKPITLPFQTTPSDWVPTSITDFSGGLCTSIPKTSISDNQFAVLVNWLFEKNGTLKCRSAFRPYNYGSENDAKLSITSNRNPLSFRWVDLNSDTLVASYSFAGTPNKVRVARWTGTAWANIETSSGVPLDLTTGYKVEFLKYSINDTHDMFIFNGKDTPYRWSGTTGFATAMGLSAPVVSSATATAGAVATAGRGIRLNGKYYYKFTNFYDGTTTKYGESAPSSYISMSVALAGATETNPKVIDIAGLGALPTGVTKMKIYRSPCDQPNGPFRYVGETNTTSYVDNCPNYEEGEEPPIYDGTVPRLKFATLVSGRVVGVGINSSGNLENKLVWSVAGMPDVFLDNNYAYLPDPITGLVLFRQNLYIFTTNEIYVVPNSNFDETPVPMKICDKGCSSHYSIADVGVGIVFQGNDNIYFADFNTQAEDGDFPIAIGESIKDKIQDISKVHRSNSVATYHDGRYYLSFSQHIDRNDTTLVWDVNHGIRWYSQGISGGWSLLDWKAQDMQNFEGELYTADYNRYYIMLHGNTSGRDYVSNEDDTGIPISTALATKLLYADNETTEKIVKSFSVLGSSSGSQLTFDLSLNDGEFIKSKTFNMGSGEITSGQAVYGVSVYGTAIYAQNPYKFYSIHHKLPKGAKGTYIQAALSSGDTKDTNIVEIKIYLKASPVMG